MIRERARIFRVEAVLNAALDVEPSAIRGLRRPGVRKGRARPRRRWAIAEEGVRASIASELSLARSVQCASRMTRPLAQPIFRPARPRSHLRSSTSASTSPTIVMTRPRRGHGACGCCRCDADGGHRRKRNQLSSGSRSWLAHHRGRLFSHCRRASRITPLSSRQTLAEELEALARAPEVVAVGECGLDYFRDFSPRDVQRDGVRDGSSRSRRASASRCSCISATRTRISWRSCASITSALRAGAVAHCFTGTRRELADYLDLGLAHRHHRLDLR